MVSLQAISGAASNFRFDEWELHTSTEMRYRIALKRSFDDRAGQYYLHYCYPVDRRFRLSALG